MLSAIAAPAVGAPPRAAASPPVPAENYILRQAVTAWDMLSKVDTLCPDGELDRQARRLKELEAVAKQRLNLSAKAVLENCRTRRRGC